MPGLKPKSDGKADQPRKPRKRRPHGFARTRMTPIQRMEHVLEQCPDCGTQLSGGSTHHTREVIELPQVPVEVTEHAYLSRTCLPCRCVPSVQLEGVVLGQQRLGTNLLSLIAALREEARLPFRTIQWYLEAVHGLRLSVGAIVSATQRVAQKAQTLLTDIVERIRGSPVVHADETGWWEDGHNGYVWTFSTPDLRYFLRRDRSKSVVDEALGEEFAGVLVSDFYAAYHHYDGPKQRCWAHLLRDIHDQRALYPDDHRLGRWADAVNLLYRQAKAFTHPSERQRRSAALARWPRLEPCRMMIDGSGTGPCPHAMQSTRPAIDPICGHGINCGQSAILWIAVPARPEHRPRILAGFNMHIPWWSGSLAGANQRPSLN